MKQVEPRFEHAPGGVDWRLLSHGMPVRFRDGGVGTIEHLWIDSHHAGIGQLVVRLAVPPSQEMIVPLDRVQFVDELGVDVDMDSVPVALLPAHIES